LLTGKAPFGAFLVLKISVFYNFTSSKTVIFDEIFFMRIYLSVLVGLAVICVDVRAQKLNRDFEKLHLLVGTWKMETSKGALYETWQKINDSTLRGHSYKLNGKDTVVLEQVELIRRKGNIFSSYPKWKMIFIRSKIQPMTFPRKLCIHFLPIKCCMHG
jgi:hypothetical protein